MPISLTLTEGVMTPENTAIAVREITRAFLESHELGGNKVMTPNVTTHLNILPEGHTFSGGMPVAGAWIETKTPEFALADYEIQSAFFGKATEILVSLAEGRLSKDRVWSNGVHTVDGTWNLNGKAMANAALGMAIAAG